MGVIYIMWNFPFFWKIKIGITTFGKTRKRVQSVSKTTPGWVFPIFASILPWGVMDVEKQLHRILKPIHTPFRTGSGKTEWFHIIGLLVAVPVITIETVVRWSPLIILVLLALR